MRKFLVKEIAATVLEHVLNNPPKSYEVWAVVDANGSRKDHCHVIFRLVE